MKLSAQLIQENTRSAKRGVERWRDLRKSLKFPLLLCELIAVMSKKRRRFADLFQQKKKTIEERERLFRLVKSFSLPIWWDKFWRDWWMIHWTTSANHMILYLLSQRVSKYAVSCWWSNEALNIRFKYSERHSQRNLFLFARWSSKRLPRFQSDEHVEGKENRRFAWTM